MCSWCSSWTPRTTGSPFSAWNIFQLVNCFGDLKVPRCSPHGTLHRHIFIFPKQFHGCSLLMVKHPLTDWLCNFWVTQKNLGNPDFVSGMGFSQASILVCGAPIWTLKVSGYSRHTRLQHRVFKLPKTTRCRDQMASDIHCQTRSSTFWKFQKVLVFDQSFSRLNIFMVFDSFETLFDSRCRPHVVLQPQTLICFKQTFYRGFNTPWKSTVHQPLRVTIHQCV